MLARMARPEVVRLWTLLGSVPWGTAVMVVVLEPRMFDTAGMVANGRAVVKSSSRWRRAQGRLELRRSRIYEHHKGVWEEASDMAKAGVLGAIEEEEKTVVEQKSGLSGCMCLLSPHSVLLSARAHDQTPTAALPS